MRSWLSWPPLHLAVGLYREAKRLALDHVAEFLPESETGSASLSDAFPLRPDLRSVSRLTFQGRLGTSFVDAIFALDPGAWSGPIRSAFGVPFVRVERVDAPALPPVEAVRTRVLRIAAEERGADRLASGLARLEKLYDVRIEASL